MSWSSVPLRVLIESAYSLQPFQIVGGPDWIDSDRWDIEAKSDSPTSTVQKLRLLRPLLEERFQLTSHRASKQVMGFSLAVAKNGSKLHEAPDNSAPTDKSSTKIGRGVIEGHRIPIAQLVAFLTSELGRPVKDSTGLAGKYDFKLDWVPDESQPNSGGIASARDAEGPTIFSAIRDQLGLTLKPQKELADILVIDHVEKPNGT